MRGACFFSSSTASPCETYLASHVLCVSYIKILGNVGYVTRLGIFQLFRLHKYETKSNNVD